MSSACQSYGSKRRRSDDSGVVASPSLAEQEVEIASLQDILKQKQALVLKTLTVCTICRDTQINPVRVCINGHYACAACVLRLANHTQIPYSEDKDQLLTVYMPTDLNQTILCPVCREPRSLASVKTTQDSTIGAVLDSPVGGCPFDCGATLTNCEVFSHLLQCANRTHACDKCGIQVVYNQMDRHQRHDCESHACQLCKGTQTEYKYDNLSCHSASHIFDIRDVLMQRLNKAIDIVINPNGVYGQFNNNTPLNYCAMQEALHLNRMLKVFEEHDTNDTHQAWLSGDERSEAQLLVPLYMDKAVDECHVVVPPPQQ